MPSSVRDLPPSASPSQPLFQPSSASASAMNHYVRIPNKLVETCVLQNRAHYLGIYAFIGRHYLITHKPVVLSANDLLQFDPSLSYGQSVRALNWLCENGWAVPTTHKGQKTCYLPSWGLVGGQPVAWDATDQRFGRRPHQQAYVRLDVRIFDVYMGTLTLHSEYRAQRRGYITAPLLSLADVGSFVQRHLGYGKPTEALFQYGLVSTAGNVRPLPSDKTILTQASQRNLLQPDAPYITEAGLTRLGILQSEPLVADQTSHLLFFIPRDKIDGGIERMIGRMIDPAPAPQVAFSPSVCQIQPIPGTIESMREKGHEVPEKHDPPQHSTNEGADSISRPILTIPDTEAVATLRKFAIRSGKPINPRVLIELSSLSLDDISYGINVASVAQNVRDPVALAVATIRDRRDYKDTSPTPPAYSQPENQMIVDIEKYGSLIRLGSDTSDLPPTIAATNYPYDNINLNDVWAEVLSRLRVHIARVHIAQFVSSELVGLSPSQAQILAPTLSAKQVIETRIHTLRTVLMDILNWPEITIRVVLQRSGVQHAAPVIPTAPSALTLLDHPSLPSCPNWLPASLWTAFPALLRLALENATYDGVAIHTATSGMMRVLEHYTEQIAEIIQVLKDSANHTE